MQSTQPAGKPCINMNHCECSPQVDCRFAHFIADLPCTKQRISTTPSATVEPAVGSHSYEQPTSYG